jgi:Raf kinase inhibitor-like YbhB/YbcL family protein
MKLHSNSFEHRGRIPAEFAFGRPGDAGEACVLSANRNPHLAWSEVPAGTQSFALLCIDPDVPSRPDDVNQPDREVPAALPRVDFTHWAMIDLPAALREIAAGSCSEGVVPHGKQNPPGPAGTRQGENDYTGWFQADPGMQGSWRGYDGPCPPFNDALEHRYFFRLFALDVTRLELPTDRFTAGDVQRAMQGHILAEALIYGRYTLNPRLRG